MALKWRPLVWVEQCGVTGLDGLDSLRVERLNEIQGD